MDRRVWKRRNLFWLLQLGIFGGKEEDFCQPYKSMNVNTDFIYVKTFAATQNI